jgi:uncharacterized protein with PIN domain
MTLARRRRRIRDLGTIGFLPIGLTMVMLESNLARQIVVLVAVFYAALMGILLLRASRCPQCKSLLSTRALRIGRAKITIPWYFRPTCRRCGWSESNHGGEVPAKPEEHSVS